MNGKQLADFVAKVADDKRAEDIVTLDMRGISTMSDFFVICHGNSDRQVQSIARDIKDQAYKNGIAVRRMEGFDNARWILIDLGDVIAHVFHREDRDYYKLEKLWGDAPREVFEGESNINV
ncbi:ribosomal silencing factor RsfS [Pullulanibacillus camelliae]|uniref:Ribosomal silencing factor RsfS n=1 Tax=Pullulanibacillus camelliae TaxID=1707096 RepID=A0A8J2YHQ3_9BACL|nr:ribosome silencing factor [Pullulanibacillus camelliae]GGE43369.1 ribosomal silencing factor RsfS [Pullulanibacillus camelliae]